MMLAEQVIKELGCLGTEERMDHRRTTHQQRVPYALGVALARNNAGALSVRGNFPEQNIWNRVLVLEEIVYLGSNTNRLF